MSDPGWLEQNVLAPVRSFLRGAPSPGALYRSLSPEFEALHAVAPSEAVVDEPVTLTLQAWDGYERLVPGFDGEVALTTTDPTASLPERVRFSPREDGLLRVENVRFREPGLHYITATFDEVGTVSNPVRVTAEPPDLRTYWGDIHLHSQFSDGAGSMERGFAFGRDVMDLDVVAYTDHDTMGFFIPPDWQRWLMRHRNLPRIRERVAAHHNPGEFVTLFGYEWTKQPHAGGHVNCYFDTVDAPFFDSRSPESDTYEKLWTRLREWRAEQVVDRPDEPPEAAGTDRDDTSDDGPDSDDTSDDGPDSDDGDEGDGVDRHADVVTIPHHPAEAMYPFDFAATAVDDELAPLVETYSQWGSSERPAADGNRKPIGGMGQGEVGERGHYAQDALALGNRMGLVAGSDFHGPRPGHSLVHVDPHLPREALRDGLGWGTIWRIMDEDSYAGGLTAFRAPELSREAVFTALRERRVYGTTQPARLRVRFALDGRRLSDPDHVVPVDGDGGRELSLRVAGTAPLAAVEVVRNAETWRTVEGGDGPEGFERYVATATLTDEEPVAGLWYDDERGSEADCYYLRVVQADGRMAWAGPLWASPTG